MTSELVNIENKKQCILIKMNATVWCLIAFFTVLNIVMDAWWAALTVGWGTLVISPLTHYFAKKKHLTLARRLFLISCFIYIYSGSLIFKHQAGVENFFYSLLVMSLFLTPFKNKTELLINVLLPLTGLCAIFFFGYDFLPEGLTHEIPFIEILYRINVFGTFFTIGIFIFYFLKIMVDLEKDIIHERDALKQAQKVAQIGSWSMKVNDRSMLWSDQMFEMFQARLGDEMTYDHFIDSIDIDYLEMVESTFHNNTLNKQSFNLEFKTVNIKGESLWVSLTAQADFDQHSSFIGFHGTCQDISQIKVAESRLEEEKFKVVQTSKLASIGEMAAGIAHEINNPLAIIHGNASLMIRHLKNPDKQLKSIEKIQNSVKRISKIINGLRKFSRGDDGIELREVSVRELLDETYYLVESKLKLNGVKLQFNDFRNIEADLVTCDQMQIQQVMINLIGNAVDAVCDKANSWVRLEVEKKSEHFVFKVIDSGEGIEQKTLNKLFDPFFTTKVVGKGTGLGLSISKGIVEDHRGELIYQLEDGHTCFKISLPISAESLKAA